MDQEEAYRQILQNLKENDDEMYRIARVLVTDLIESFTKSSKKGYRVASVQLATSLGGAMRYRLVCGQDAASWQRIFADISREYPFFSLSTSSEIHHGMVTELNISVRLKEK